MSESIRVLLADDHPLFREGVATSLTASGEFYVVATAGSGEEAVDLARRLQPDLVMLDISMPGMGGIAAAARIAVDQPGVRLMMLTMAETPESLMAALKAGAHGYVLKGVSASELRDIVRRIAAGEAYVTPALAAAMLNEFSRPRAAGTFETLTARETGVLDLLSQGLTNREIGERLHLAEKTIKHHVTIILQKLQVRSRTEAALLAVQQSGARGGKA